MIELSKQLEELMEEISKDTGEGILDQWNKIERLKKEYIGHLSEFIEEQRQEIGLNSSTVLGEYIFSLFMHDRPYINALMFTKAQAEVMDSNFKEKFTQKLNFTKNNVQFLKALSGNPYMMERYNITKEMLSDMESEVEQEAEADLDLASLYDKPYKYKKDDMYLRQCEKNLWVEMHHQLNPKITANDSIWFMIKLWKKFNYENFDTPERKKRFDMPIDTNARFERLKKRRTRDLKSYRKLQ